MTQTVSIDITAAQWMSSNHRPNWVVKAQKTAVIRLLAKAAALAGLKRRKLQRLARADVVATIHYPFTRRQDPANSAPAVKAAIDGCVDAHLLPDDDAAHLPVLAFRRGEPTGRDGWYRIDLTFKGESA